MPSFIVILLVARFFRSFSDHPVVKAVLSGIRPVVVGILFAVMLSLSIKALFHSNLWPLAWAGFDWKALVIFVLILTVSRIWKKTGPIFLILLSAGMGILLYGLL
jgi:chromate transporter